MSELEKIKSIKIQDGKRILKQLELDLVENNKTLSKIIKDKQEQVHSLKEEIQILSNKEQEYQQQHQKMMFELENLKTQISACQEKVNIVKVQINQQQQDQDFLENIEQLRMSIEDIKTHNFVQINQYQETINNFFFVSINK